MENYSYRRPASRTRNQSGARFIFFSLLIILVIFLGYLSFSQFLAVRSMQNEMQTLQDELDSIRETFTEMETENRHLRQEFDVIFEENEKLREDNLMLRSSTIISHGNRKTNKVAITIDDGAGEALIAQTLDYLAQHNVKATLFPLGRWVELNPEVWRRAVEEGHELGNHTYSHRYLTTMNEEQIRNELNGWQSAVDEALGYPYETFFFRPPGMDGFVNSQSARTKGYQEIIASKGMVAALWDVDHFYGLRNEVNTPGSVANFILAQAKPGSIILMHFNHTDIAALPAILTGLRSRGLEPCSLSELLLTEPQS